MGPFIGRSRLLQLGSGERLKEGSRGSPGEKICRKLLQGIGRGKGC